MILVCVYNNIPNAGKTLSCLLGSFRPCCLSHPSCRRGKARIEIVGRRSRYTSRLFSVPPPGVATIVPNVFLRRRERVIMYFIYCNRLRYITLYIYIYEYRYIVANMVAIDTPATAAWRCCNNCSRPRPSRTESGRTRIRFPAKKKKKNHNKHSLFLLANLSYYSYIYVHAWIVNNYRLIIMEIVVKHV